MKEKNFAENHGIAGKTQKSGHHRIMRMITAAFLLIFLGRSLVYAETAKTAETSETAETSDLARLSVSSSLHVEGTKLQDESGTPVILRGVSTHDIMTYPEFLSPELFAELHDDWNVNVIRLAVYPEEYAKDKDAGMARVREGIEMAIEEGLYVIVDWHMIGDRNYARAASEAGEFLDQISAAYAEAPNVLYEICNEPDTETDWQTICEYAKQVIPAIRKNSPDAVIIVGTPDYDKDILAPLQGGLEQYGNLVYAFHFYAATHEEDYRERLMKALEAGVPVFVSECGITKATGDGFIDLEQSQKWFSLLKEKEISCVLWNLSNKKENSALFKPSMSPERKITDEDLTLSGRFVKALMKTDDPKAAADQFSWWQKALLICENDARDIWKYFAAGALSFLLICSLIVYGYNRFPRVQRNYETLLKKTGGVDRQKIRSSHVLIFGKMILVFSAFASVIYLSWRILFSIPLEYGMLPITCNLILLAVEVIGFAESMVHYASMLRMKEYLVPDVDESLFPEVDIFIATYNEPEEILRKTIIGCKKMDYPDPEKVHIWLCDDNRRATMRALAEELGIGYFDREDHVGAKAGNLNHALALTHAPYIVTFDADMIPRREFLMKTIPYFVDAEMRNAELRNAQLQSVRLHNPGSGEIEQMPLGLIQTPQAFYNPDVFQHNLYAEYRATNEQDFFYRTIEVARTATNSVIYGGSNTLIARRALEQIGGFYTGSITEDFATGMLIEGAGYISLGLSEPLASGIAPFDFAEHVRQRKRWGRGCVNTARKLKILKNNNLNLKQKISYLSSVVYWYSSLCNFVYILSPIMFAVFGIPVFRCSWMELLVFWLPMFILQNLSLRCISQGVLSPKWSGIQETSMMPFLFFPILKETFGISLSEFLVTDKRAGVKRQQSSGRLMAPFVVLIGLTVVGIIRVLWMFWKEFSWMYARIGNAGDVIYLKELMPIGLLVILFWLTRNLYYLFMSLMLVRGRESDGETVKVKDAIPVHAVHLGNLFDARPSDNIVTDEGKVSTAYVEEEAGYDGITTLLTEHSISIYLDEKDALRLGSPVDLTLYCEEEELQLTGTIVGIRKSRKQNIPSVYTVEILDFHGEKDQYIYHLYNRIPSLPQNLLRDHSMLYDLWHVVIRG